MKQLRFFFTIAFLSVCLASGAQDSTHKEITGKYKFPAGSVVEEVVVANENGAFTMSSTVGVSALELLKGDTFNIVSFNGIAVFKRDDARKITGVHIDASGYILDGVKDSAAVSPALTGLFGRPVKTAVEKPAAGVATEDGLLCFMRPSLRQSYLVRDRRHGMVRI